MPWLTKKNCSEIYDDNDEQINIEQYMHPNNFKLLTKKFSLVCEDLDELGVLPSEDEAVEIANILFTDMLLTALDSIRDEG